MRSKSKQKGRWRRSLTFPDYEISDFGSVRRLVDSLTRKAGHVLTPQSGKRGDLRFHLSRDGKKYCVYGHVLVLECFVGPKPSPKHEGAHNDGKPWNNYYKNLRWDTRKGNHADLQKHGTAVKGERNGRAKLTNVDVSAIRKEYAALGCRKYGNVKRLREQYGIGSTTLREIVLGTKWVHVS